MIKLYYFFATFQSFRYHLLPLYIYGLINIFNPIFMTRYIITIYTFIYFCDFFRVFVIIYYHFLRIVHFWVLNIFAKITKFFFLCSRFILDFLGWDHKKKIFFFESPCQLSCFGHFKNVQFHFPKTLLHFFCYF